MRSRHLLQNGQKSCHLSGVVTINEQIPDCGESSCGRWQHAMERQMAILCRGGDGNHLPKIHACVQFLHTCASTLVHTHTHRCAEGTDDDGAVWGGPMAPINGLITGHPGWHALLGRNPDERIWEIRKYAQGNWNRVRSMEMNHLLVVVRDGKNSNTGAVDSVTLCLFV